MNAVMKRRLVLAAGIFAAGLFTAGQGLVMGQTKATADELMLPDLPAEPVQVVANLPAKAVIPGVGFDFEAASEEANKIILSNEIQARVLNSQLEVIKIKSEQSRLQNQMKAGDGQAAPGPAEQLPAVQRVVAPAVVIDWIAGRTDDLEAQVSMAGVGSVIVRKGNTVPGTAGLTVKTVSPTGLVLSAPDGSQMELGFSR